jgi:amino-acid N-acetyltransferase
MSVILRTATSSDASAIHSLVTTNLEAGHLLPRTIDDIQEHAARFFVAELEGQVVGCAELARLSPSVAEVRSLVVQESLRGQRIGTRLVSHLASRATVAGYGTLCAFTHDPSHFVRLGFTIVPHIWMPEKIAHDCTGCALFRRCGQYAVRLGLRQGLPAAPERPALMIHGRGIAPRRPNIERLQPVAAGGDAEPKPIDERGKRPEREDQRREAVVA